MNSRIFFTLIVILSAITLFSTLGNVVAAENASSPERTQQISTASASGSGWFICREHRDGFRFSVTKGNLGPDGWNYNPVGFVGFVTKPPAFNIIGQVQSMRIWRFRVDSIDGGVRVVVVGIAQTRVGGDVRNNWLFRAVAQSLDDGKDGFMIQLWRPVGADKSGGWSFRDFDTNRPATLKFNDLPFYQARGLLTQGSIQIMP